MKTNYQKPATCVTLLAFQPLMAAASPAVNSDGTEVNTGKDPQEGDAGGAAGRRAYNVWDDDDEE